MIEPEQLLEEVKTIVRTDMTLSKFLNGPSKDVRMIDRKTVGVVFKDTNYYAGYLLKGQIRYHINYNVGLCIRSYQYRKDGNTYGIYLDYVTKAIEVDERDVYSFIKDELQGKFDIDAVRTAFFAIGLDTVRKRSFYTLRRYSNGLIVTHTEDYPHDIIYHDNLQDLLSVTLQEVTKPTGKIYNDGDLRTDKLLDYFRLAVNTTIKSLNNM